MSVDENIQFLIKKYWCLDETTFEIIKLRYRGFGSKKQLIQTSHEGIFSIDELKTLQETLKHFLSFGENKETIEKYKKELLGRFDYDN